MNAGDPGEDGWQRLHPLTPVVRGWKVVAAVLAGLAVNNGDDLLQMGLPSARQAIVAVLVLLAVVVLAGVYALLAWQRSTYRVDEQSLQLRRGVLFRQQRQARLDRLQAVDVVRPLLARFFGLAELKLEVAGGSDSAISLSLLREREAQELRNTLLARAAGLSYDSELAPQAPEHEVLAVSVARTLESFARSVSTLVLLVFAFGALVAVVVTGKLALLGFGGPALLGVGTALWAKFSSAFGFRVATSPDGIRLHHGLLTTRSQTVPPGRVQAVRLRQPLLWRSRDWWSVEVNVAGYGSRPSRGEVGGEKAGQENLLLTVGSRAEALLVLRLAVPALHRLADHESDQRAVTAGLTGTAPEEGFVVASRISRWLDPIGWSRHGVAVLDDVLLLRRGRLIRELDVVPHARTQSLAVEQGPLQRRLGLASFVVHSTPGPISPSVAHLPEAVAALLLNQQSARARVARACTGDLDQGPWLPSQAG